MPFKKGKSGNKKGRPRGAVNKKTTAKGFKEALEAAGFDFAERWLADYNKLKTPSERLAHLEKAAPYLVPKVSEKAKEAHGGAIINIYKED